MTELLVGWAILALILFTMWLYYLWRMMLHSIYWSNDPLHILELTDINIHEAMRYRGLDK